MRRRRQFAVGGVLVLLLLIYFAFFSGGGGNSGKVGHLHHVDRPGPPCHRRRRALPEALAAQPRLEGQRQDRDARLRRGRALRRGRRREPRARTRRLRSGTTIPQLFSGAQLRMVNLETAVTDGTCPEPQSKPYIFDAPGLGRHRSQERVHLARHGGQRPWHGLRSAGAVSEPDHRATGQLPDRRDRQQRRPGVCPVSDHHRRATHRNHHGDTGHRRQPGEHAGPPPAPNPASPRPSTRPSSCARCNRCAAPRTP